MRVLPSFFIQSRRGRRSACFAASPYSGMLEMPPGFAVESPALAQAKATASRSSGSVRASGAFLDCRSYHRALPPKISPAPVVSTTVMPFRLSTWPLALQFWNQQPSAPHVTNTSFTG